GRKNLPKSRKIFQKSKLFKVCTNPSGTCGSKIFQNLEKSSKNPNFSRFARTLRARAGRKSSRISRNLPKSRKVIQNLEKSSKISTNLPKIQNFQGLHEPFGHVRVENLPKSRKIFQNLKKSSKNPKFSRFARTLRARAGRKSSKISKNLPKIQNFQGLHEPFG